MALQFTCREMLRKPEVGSMFRNFLWLYYNIMRCSVRLISYVHATFCRGM